MDINLGKYRLNPRGEYNNEETYYYLDFVEYKGSTYYVKYLDPETKMEVPVSKILPVGEDNSETYWGLLSSKGEVGPKAEEYDGFITLKNTTWNYKDLNPNNTYSDKIIVPDDMTFSSALVIKGVYDGCCGLMLSKNKNIKLPENSMYSNDFNYIDINDNQYYLYTFVYSASIDKFIWNRSVIDE